MKVKILRNTAVFFLLLTAGAGYLYGKFLLTGFEPDTGLAIPGNPYEPALIVFIGAIVLFAAMGGAIASAVSRRGSAADLFLLSTPPVPVRVLYCASALLLLAGGIAKLQSAFTQVSAKDVVLAIFTLATAGALLSLFSIQKSAKTRAYQGVLFIVPVFWAAFRLILVFRDASVNPVINSYLYDLLCMIFILLALFSYVSFFYKKQSYFAAVALLYVNLGFSAFTAAGHLMQAVSGTGGLLKTPEPYDFILLFFSAFFSLAALLHWYFFEKKRAAEGGGRRYK